MIFTAIFCIVILYFCFCLIKGCSQKITTNLTFNTFSIIIAVKNESLNLQTLLDSLKKINYPLESYQIIFVDDNSTDDSFKMVKDNCQINQTIIKNAYTGKKNAIQTGINESKYDWIALTDADCIIHPDWLKSANNHILYHRLTSFFIGFSPETFINSFQYFKQLVSAFIFASTAFAGMPFSCTGRNLIIKKEAFNEVNGYMGLFQYQSGDDKLLLNKFKANKKKISYMPFPPIITKPTENSNIHNQNLRRYGKFTMSSISWRVGMTIVGLLLVMIPFEAFNTKFLSLIYYFISLEIFMLLGCFVHKEQIRLNYVFLALFFPYYLGYQMLNSKLKKWSWK